MFFELDNSVLRAAQAACVALPAAGLPALLSRLRGRAWALIGPLSVVGSVVAIEAVSASADVLTWVALILVPPGCAVGLGWAMHGARPWLGLLAVPLLAAAFAAPDDGLGQVARLALIMGSCVAVGRLLAGGTPLPFLKVGVVVMATIDAIFIFGELWQVQNAQFVTATPAEGLPRLQVAHIGDYSTDYGDFFITGVVGGILAAERRPQAALAVLTFAVMQVFNQLYLVVDSLPGTVPPTLVMLADSLLRASRRPAPDGAASPG